MLHDPEHIEPPATEDEITVPPADRDVLQRLGQEVAEIAALPAHAETAGQWARLNSLQPTRPLVWINEIPWNEMNVDDELTLQCATPFARHLETELRQTLYQWRHLPGDMVIADFLACPKAIHSTDFGIVEDVDAIKVDESSAIKSRHFNIQIQEPADIEKIQMPVVTHNAAATEARYAAMREVFGDILPVRKVGQGHIWFTPWDYLVRWWGVQEALTDLILRPDMVHAAVERMVDAWMTELDQFEARNLLELDNTNMRVGSGGYGYCRDLPTGPRDRVTPKDMWGCSNAQVFSEVSPQMHWEFALEHDLRWLARWGITYYGCCEPLDKKMHILRRIPNLRKISVSPWCDFGKVFDEIGTDYVASAKPSPAILAEDRWRPEQARAEIRQVLDAAAGECHVELIMKDVSTVRYQPQRLWEWARIAMEEVRR